jgi:hypothetical protein
LLEGRRSNRLNYTGCPSEFHFPFIFQLRAHPNLLSAASSSAYGFLLQASQASDVGSIPIARSITHDDSVVLTPLNQLKYGHKIGRFGPVMVPTRMVETMAAFLEKQCIVKGPSGPSLIGAVGGGAMAPPLPTRVDRPRSE